MNARLLVSALAAVLMTLGHAAQASNLRFLEFSPTALFNDEDWALMREAARDALENSEDGTARIWRNPETGHDGRIVPVETYQDFGTTCRRLKITNNAEDRTSTGLVSMCKDTDEDKWKIVK